MLVNYGDPAPSNKENKSNCYKVVVLMGRLGDTYYIINCRLDHVINSRFVDWYYELTDFTEERSQLYHYIENNSLQDPFWEQVYQPLFKEANKINKMQIYPTPDDRKKPDKFVRIEGNLEPLNRNGKLVFNEAEKNNPNMKRLEEQFKAVEPTLAAHVDGPDAVEGAVYILSKKTGYSGNFRTGKYSTNKRRTM